MRASRCFLTLVMVAPLLAQTNTAELSGVITDATGGVLRQVGLTLQNETTGARRSSHTDGRGYYLFSHLPPGEYSITAKLEGFQTAERRAIVLTVGREAVLDLTLRVGAVTSDTVVTADAALVETRNTALSAATDTNALRQLPPTAPDFAQLAVLTPAVAPSRRSSDSGGAGTKLVIGGHPPSQLIVL